MDSRPLKTLIVEDNPNKKKKLFERLSSLPDIFCDPDVVVSTSEALRRLQESEYDLMILDIVVPLKPQGDPDEQNAVDLLTRIDAGVISIKRPKFVLQISSVSTLSNATRDFLRGRPWGCIQYSEDSTQALDDVEHVGRWIHQQSQIDQHVSACDVFVATALEEPEFVALEAAAPNLGPLVPLDSTQLIRNFSVNCGERTIRVGAGFAPRMGPVASAILCTKVIEMLRPKLIVMAGICGAIGSKASIGDLVAADASWDWQSGKYINEGGADFQIAPHQLGVSSEVRSILIKMKRDERLWGSFARDAIGVKTDLPKLVLGPMATGASVIADERITKKIREEQHKNVVAVDMETYAVYAAAASASYRIGVLSLKAVCDRADVVKDDRYQSYAAKVSARCVLNLLEEYGDELLSAYGGASS